jgi:hypothetical protein
MTRIRERAARVLLPVVRGHADTITRMVFSIVSGA